MFTVFNVDAESSHADSMSGAELGVEQTAPRNSDLPFFYSRKKRLCTGINKKMCVNFSKPYVFPQTPCGYCKPCLYTSTRFLP